MTVHIKRIYEPYEKADGYRILVDRLWPRGVKKDLAHVDVWMKEVAPSTALRKWFNHDPKNWTGFCAKYYAEVKGSQPFEDLMLTLKKHKVVTLVYSAKDEQYNQAAALKEFAGKRKQGSNRC